MGAGASSAADGRRAGGIRWARVAVLALLVGLLVATFLYVDPRSLSPVAVRDWVQGFGWLGPSVYVLMFVVGAIVVAPLTLLAAVGALLFPLPVALAVVWGSMVLATTATFWLARWLGRGFVEERLGRHVRRIDARLSKSGFKMVLLMRVSGLPPANVLNYAAGLTKLRYRDYLLGTALGLIPYVVVVVTVVNRIGSSPRIADILRDPVLYAALAAVVIVVGFGHALRRRTDDIVELDEHGEPVES